MNESPIDSVKDRVAHFDPSSTSDAKKSVTDGQLVEKTNVTDPDCEAKVETLSPLKQLLWENRIVQKDQLWRMMVPQGTQARQLPSWISCLRKSEIMLGPLVACSIRWII